MDVFVYLQVAYLARHVAKAKLTTSKALEGWVIKLQVLLSFYFHTPFILQCIFVLKQVSVVFEFIEYSSEIRVVNLRFPVDP